MAHFSGAKVESPASGPSARTLSRARYPESTGSHGTSAGCTHGCPGCAASASASHGNAMRVPWSANKIIGEEAESTPATRRMMTPRPPPASRAPRRYGAEARHARAIIQAQRRFHSARLLVSHRVQVASTTSRHCAQSECAVSISCIALALSTLRAGSYRY